MTHAYADYCSPSHQFNRSYNHCRKDDSAHCAFDDSLISCYHYANDHSTVRAKTLIDRITYTASLVTYAREIDPYLDSVRAITSRTGFLPERMSPQDQQTLSTIQDMLENYLVNTETLRLFTRESLHAQIDQHLSGDHKAKQGMLKVSIVLGMALISAILAILLPVLSSNPLEHFIFAGAVTSVFMNAGAAWLFVSALSAFKSKLRQAFKFICAGMVLLGLGLLLEPYVELSSIQYNASNLATFTVMPIVVLSVGLMYTGVALYATLAGVRSRVLSPKLLLVVVMGLIVLVLLVPGSHSSSKVSTDLSVFLHGLLVSFATLMIILLSKATHLVADLYRPPLYALLHAIVVLVIASAAFVGITASAGPHLTNTMSGILFMLLFVIGGMLLRAGYKFNKVSRY